MDVSQANQYFVAKDYDKAREFYEKALGVLTCSDIHKLAYCYLNSHQLDLAEVQLQRAADQGNLDALCVLGDLYFDQKKYSLAEEVYTKASEKGHASATYLLAAYYADTKNPKARTLYTLAIERGNIHAMRELAYLYEDENEIMMAIRYYEMAVGCGDHIAMCDLGDLYYGQSDMPSAIKYYQMAADNGYHLAMRKLGDIYYDQGEVETATKHYQMAINFGDHTSMCNLGLIQTTREDAQRYLLMAIMSGYTFREPDPETVIDAFAEASDYDDRKKLVSTEPLFVVGYYQLSAEEYEYFSALPRTSDTCGICGDTEDSIATKCCHYYCATCYLETYKTQKGLCAFCRRDGMFFSNDTP